MDASELSQLYKTRFTVDTLSRKQSIWKIICRSYLQRFITHTDTVLDVACGYGEFINNIKASRRIAIDLNPDTVKHLEASVEFSQCKATEISKIVNNDIDVVFTSNFLEHLPDKKTLELFFDEVLIILKAKGRFIILGPNLRYLSGKYWDYYDHNLGLTHLSLCEVLKLKGFKIELCINRFLPYTTKGCLPTHPFLVWTYLRTPILWPFLGKQFFIVARKV